MWSGADEQTLIQIPALWSAAACPELGTDQAEPFLSCKMEVAVLGIQPWELPGGRGSVRPYDFYITVVLSKPYIKPCLPSPPHQEANVKAKCHRAGISIFFIFFSIGLFYIFIKTEP